MRWGVVLAVLWGCSGPATTQRSALATGRVGAGDWTRLATLSLPGAESARVDAVGSRLFVGTPTALVSVSFSGEVTSLASANRVAALGVAPDGAVLWSEDVGGGIYRWTAEGGAGLWVDGFLDGDDDPGGFAFAPPGYAGPGVGAGEALLVDRGSGGPDGVWAFSASQAQGERLVHADDGTLRSATDVALFPTGAVIADPGGSAAGRLLRLEPSGGLWVLASGLDDPVGVDWDPISGQLLVADAGAGAVLAVHPTTGHTTSLPLALPPFGAGRWANLQVALGGALLVVTVDDAVVVFGRCGVGAPEDDCDGSGVADVCERVSGALLDCDADAQPDVCQPGGPGAPDCDCDGWFDGCGVCEDVDGDGLGPACDTCTDVDGDGVGDAGFDRSGCPGGPVADVCPLVFDDQSDRDGDGVGDACDPCTDPDGDGAGDPDLPRDACPLGDVADVCPRVSDDQSDRDGDGVGDACDPCTDPDGDGAGDPDLPRDACPLGDVADVCPLVSDDQSDVDGDGVGDACDPCQDTDGDGAADPGAPTTRCDWPLADDCPDVANGDQLDADGDGVGDACDPCTDTDGDGAADPGFGVQGCAQAVVDRCPDVPTTTQDDADDDGQGDACDACTDVDGDGYGDVAFETAGCFGVDCDDASPSVHPGAVEWPYDGVDQDCDGADLCDVDGDRWDAVACGGADCDDQDPRRHPEAPEVPNDGVDQDCDPSNDLGCGCRHTSGGSGAAGGLLVLALVLRRRHRVRLIHS